MHFEPAFLEQKFNQAMTFEEYVALAAALGQDGPWHERYGRLELDASQQALVGSFTRPIKILSLTGTWCGDCVLQGAAIARIAGARPDLITLRYLQREDEQADLITRSQINAGFRVPVTWFMAEDFEPVTVFGDRTLSRYGSMARKALPEGSCPVLADQPQDPVREVLQEMLDIVERIHLILRTSSRWRSHYGD